MTTTEQYIEHVKQSFEKAENGESKLPVEVLEMEGMTGVKTCHFYNNLLTMKGATYLEIGCWKGSSTCSALYGNTVNADIIDNFSGFGGPKDEFLCNFRRHCATSNAIFHEQDCFTMPLKDLIFDAFNIYLFDGDHSTESQKKALTYYLPVLDDVFIFICDDWNWPEVRLGTESAISESGLKVLHSEIRRTTTDGTFPADQDAAKNGFWNGIAVFVLQKP